MSDENAERLDYAERWLRDGLDVVRPAFCVLQTTVDMSSATRWLENNRRHRIHATSTHLLVHAVARALHTNANLHQIVAGVTRQRPTRVDIGLSVAGESFVSPVLVIEGADAKSVAEIAEETTRRTPEIRATDQRMLRTLRRWGWLVPFGFLRRTLLRLLFRSPMFRRQGAGTFQVSTVPMDWALSSVFSTAGVLVAGQTRSMVVVVDGQPAVRPMMTLTLSGDHGVWDARASARFMAAVKSALESGCFDPPLCRTA